MASRRSLACLSFMAISATLTVASRAPAQPTTPPWDSPEGANTCVSSFEGAQSDRMVGKFVSARARLPACLLSTCPTRVRDDCARMRDELDRATPTATFAVRDADGTDLDATLAIDGAPVDLHAGRALLLDPGTHVVTYTLPGESSRTTKVTLFEGEKTRLVVINPARSVPVDGAKIDVEKRSLVAPAVIGLAGVGLAVTSVIFAAKAIGSANDAAALAHVVPVGVAPCQDHSFGKADPNFCAAAEDSKTSTTVAVVTGLAGTAAIGTAVVMTILELRRPHRTTPTSSAQVAPTIGPQGAGASLAVSF